jgi:hypothetical protein
MKKVSLIGSMILISSVFLFTGCITLKTMKKNADKVNYSVVPEVLETHAGKIDVAIQSQFPAKYFAKKATITVTPILKYAGGETALTPYVLQGEKVQGNNKVITIETGGSNSFKGTIPYSKEMQRSDLEVHIKATQGTKSLDFLPRTIGKGVIATSTLVDNSPLSILGSTKKANNSGVYDATTDKYQRIVPDAYMADLVYLINSSEVRKQELTKAEIEHLN